MLEDKNEHRMMIRSAQLFQRGLEQRQIAEKLGTSQSKVSRLLKLAREIGVFRVKTSRETDLEDELAESFNLTDALVVIVDENIEPSKEIGQTASFYFNQIISDGMRVGISGGQTLYHMIDALPTKRRSIEIYPIFSGRKNPVVNFLYPNHLVALLYEKTANASVAYTLDVPPFEGAKAMEIQKEKERFLERPQLKRVYQRIQNSLDICFSGIGCVTPDSSLVAFAEQVGSSFEDLQAKEAIGDLSHIVYNRHAEEVESLVKSATIGLGGIQKLQEIAGAPNRQMIAVAGGPQKWEAIFVALKYKLVDTLITDHNTTEALLAMNRA